MKRRLIVSGVLAFLIAAAVCLAYCLPSSNFIQCYEIDSDNNLYTVSEYDFGNYLQIKNSKTGKSSFHSLRYRYSSEAVYYDMRFHGGKLYLLVCDEGQFVVDTYDSHGQYLGRVYSFAPTAGEMYIANLSLGSQWLVDEGYQDFRLDCVILSDNEIMVKRVDGKATGNETLHYVTDCQNFIMWAGFIEGRLVYLNEESELYWIDENMKSNKLDIPEQCVINAPMTYFSSIIAVDLSDLCLKGFTLLYDDETKTMEVYVDDSDLLRNSYPVADGVAFEDLRSVKLKNWSDGQYTFTAMGVVKDYKRAGRIYCMDARGMSADCSEFVEPRLGAIFALIVFLLWGAISFVLILVVVNIISYLLSLRKVVIKQILMSIAIVLAASCYMYFKLSDVIVSTYDSAMSSTMTDMLKYVSSTIDADYFAEHGLTEEQRSGMREFEYKGAQDIRVETSLFSLYSDSGLNSTVQYFEVSRLVDGEYIYEYFSDMKPGARARYYLDDDIISRMKSLSENSSMIVDYRVEGRTWINAYALIVDSNGNNVGCIAIGSWYTPIETNAKSMALRMVLSIALILVLTCAAFLIVLQKLLSPLKKIKKAVSEIAKGKIGTTVSIRSNDELQDIAHSFTDMSQKLLEYFNNINVISKAYERYLPRDFFTLMDKRNVMEVNPEDRKKVTLTYLFVGMDTSSIHSKGTDGFAVINRIYGIVSSAVAANGGVVQALDDKCITCIFSSSAAAAVEAALTVQEKLTVEEFRQADIRISIQRAESTIGVIGTAEAMKTITVSSAISTQKYIAFFMKQFMLTAVTTGAAKANFGTLNVTTRYIGKFSSFYEKLSLENDEELYEMIDGCAPEDKQKKLASLASFNRGMDAIAAGNYKEGRKNMIDVLRINRDDMIARHYLNVCEEGSSLFKEKKNESVFD